MSDLQRYPMFPRLPLLDVDQFPSFPSRATIATIDAGRWQTMDSVPRDGTWFWGLCDESAIMMFWCARFKVFTSSTFRSVERYDDPFLAMHKHAPTHWMWPVLPSPVDTEVAK